MLTEEQIQNLKKGDPIVVHTTFDHFDDEYDIWFHAPGVRLKNNIDYIAPEFVSLPSDSQSSTVNSQSKYDPTRLFREGDKVRLVEKNGRKPFTSALNHLILRVAADEDYKGLVSIEEPCFSDTFVIPYSHLELVTPIEELEPYSIDPANTNVLSKHGKKFATFEDDDDALDMRDLLNKKYRKEQEND